MLVGIQRNSITHTLVVETRKLYSHSEKGSFF